MDSSGDGGDESAGVGKPESPAPASAPAAGGGASASGSGGKPAAKRVMKTPYQLEVLEKTYTDDPYPNETLRVELSVKLGLTDRQLQMWFCHRRLKDRKPQREEEVAVPVIAPPPVLPPSLPHCELTVGSAGTHAEQLLPCSRRGPGRSSAVPRISVPEIGRRYYEPPQVMLPPLAPIQLTRAERRVIDSALVVGRDREREEVIQVLLNSAYPHRPGGDGSGTKRRKRCDGLAVLPIVGIGGVGKTTLAQVVYNDPRVQEHFGLRMWVCLPELLDVMLVTKDIIESATKGASVQSSLRNLDTVQGILEDLVVSRRFLLVLDNAWREDSEEWRRLCAPLKHGLPGSVILVTTRSRKVADAVGTMDPLCLSGLLDEAYWKFFRQNTFGDQDITDHPELEAIGKRIISKLNGSPLAAKTVCGILISDMSARHWRAIMNNELWELEEREGGILQALRLSYQYLPAHLKQCFTLCSIFPKGHVFRQETLIDMWIAEGFIASEESVGKRCCHELLSRGFFQKYFSDIGCVMHDLMYDLTQSVSTDECFKLESEKWQQKIPRTVRHLSVHTRYLEPSVFTEIGRYRKLRSLVIFDMPEQDMNDALDNLFHTLTNIRLLVLQKCRIRELPESIINLKNLRYLDISSTKIRMLPQSVFQLSNLQVLNMRNVPLGNHPTGISKFTNLRKFYLDGPITSIIANLSNLTSLQNSILFEVPRGQGHRIAELKNMTQLTEALHIRNLENVMRNHDAAQAMLVRKEHLRKLTLEWSSGRFEENNFSDTESLSNNTVLELLQPHLNLEHLNLRSYGGDKTPSWMQTEMLNCVREIWFSNCPNLTAITSLPSSLETLHIETCEKLTTLDECLQTHSMKRLNLIRILNCVKLASLPVERLYGFGSLRSLDVQNCPKLQCTTKLALPPSADSLLLMSSGNLDESLPGCLCNLPSLTFLGLYNCPNVRFLPKEVISHLTTLKGIFLQNCSNLQSVRGLYYLTSLVNLHIVNCPILTDFDSAMAPDKAEGQGMRKLEFLSLSQTSILRLVMRNPVPMLQTLVIRHSSDSMIIQGVQHLSQYFPSLEELQIQDCRNLEALPEGLHSLSSLRFLRICDCPKIQSLPSKGLPISLRRITYKNCQPMLLEQLKKFEISIDTRSQL